MPTDDPQTPPTPDPHAPSDGPTLRQKLHAATGDRHREAEALAERADGEVDDDAAEVAVRRAHGDIESPGTDARTAAAQSDLATPEHAKAVEADEA